MANPSVGRPATRWVGESGVTRSGMLRLERLELVQQPVELFVGNLGVVVDVVALFVVADRAAQLVDALLRRDAHRSPQRRLVSFVVKKDTAYRSRERT